MAVVETLGELVEDASEVSSDQASTETFQKMQEFFSSGYSFILGQRTSKEKMKDGHYFLNNHGWLTEVSRAVWIYSNCHAICVWVVFGLVPLSLIYGAFTEWSDADSEQAGKR